MRKIVRSETPEILKENSKKWGEEFAKKKELNPNYKFNWKTYEKKSVDKHIKPDLIKMTNNHCSFCDSYPLGVSSRKTIEHFKPKSEYPLLAYEWENLFLCCDTCQSAKREKFDDKLLKPDREDYEFNKYFIVDYKTGELKPNPIKDKENQIKAKVTIKMYDLNSEDRLIDRLDTNEMYQDLIENDKYKLNDFPYRYFLE